MRWSWKVASVAGIGIYMHFTFLLLLAWVGTSAFFERHEVVDAVSGILFVLILFMIVVWHELGHALTARHFGIRTLDITLLPIGGVARLERMPDRPAQEFLMAIAGPAVNGALALICFMVLFARQRLGYAENLELLGSGLVSKLFQVNVALTVFNLLPAFPMDGGRILRALLAMRINYVRATSIAAAIGQVMAVGIGIAGLFFNPFLVLIGLFVYVGAMQEARLVRMKSELNGVTVNEVMLTHFRTLSAADPLSRAAEQLLAGAQEDFPVLENGRLAGVLTRSTLLDGLGHFGETALVREVMESQYSTATPDEPAEQAMMRLRADQARSLPVIGTGGSILGMLTRESIRDFLQIKAALLRGATAGWRGRVVEKHA